MAIFITTGIILSDVRDGKGAEKGRKRTTLKRFNVNLTLKGEIGNGTKKH
jgi:hypothetical protein